MAQTCAETSAKMALQQYCLRWKYHNNNIQSAFSQLLDKGSFCDVTLWCGNTPMRAHRAVLASCSELLFSLLAQHEYGLGEPCIVLDKIEPQQLSQLLVFMYTGEVNVHLNELQTFLKLAEGLGVKGLADASWKDAKTENDQTSATLKQIPELKPEDLLKPTVSDHPMKLPKLQMLPLIANGSVPVSCVKSYLEPVKRKRGRPPLDPRPLSDCEVIVPDHFMKKPKMMITPNILRKSKFDKKDEYVSEVPHEWNTPLTGSLKYENGEEMHSEGSVGSLEGQDISQFLDTHIEEQPEHETQYEQKVHMLESKHSQDMHSDIAPPSDAPTITPETHPQFADVVKLSDYLVRGRRPQFWNEDYVKRVMEAVFCKELEMKQAAELLGVSYGTLYGRYRDCFGCINRPYRVQDFWNEPGPSEVLGKIHRKEITIAKAAELLNVTQLCLTNYLNSVLPGGNKDIEFADPKKYPVQTTKKHMMSSEDEDDIITIKETNGKQLKATPSEIKDIVESVSHGKLNTEDKAASSRSSNEEGEESSSSTKKLPTIRVANMKFLTGQSEDNILSDATNSSPQLLRNNPNLTITSKTKKVSFQEMALSLAKQQQVKDNQKLPDNAGKVT